MFNLNSNEVQNFLISNTLFWFDKFHIDGLKINSITSMLYLDYGKQDGEWTPNEWGGKENTNAVNFFQKLNSTIFKHYPGVITITDEVTSWPLITKPPHLGGLGFSYKWNSN